MKMSRGVRCAESWGLLTKPPFFIEKCACMYVTFEETEKNGEKLQTLGIADAKTNTQLMVAVNDEVREVLRELLDGKEVLTAEEEAELKKAIAKHWEEKK